MNWDGLERKHSKAQREKYAQRSSHTCVKCPYVTLYERRHKLFLHTIKTLHAMRFQITLWS